jgi:hypothetical protein
MIEVKNKLYQPIKLLIKDTLVLVEGKDKKIVKLDKPTAQMINAEKLGFISIKSLS